MLFDKERNIIRITLGELVSIARRGISPTLPFDEEEPNLLEVTSRRLRAILGEVRSEKLYYSFEAGEHSFELSGCAEDISGDLITVAREITSSPNKPRREETAEVRGEAFVLAHALASINGYETVGIRLVYINSLTGEYNVTEERQPREKLEKFFEKCISVVGKYAAPEIDRVTRRLPTLLGMRFPYDNVREGQGEFVRAAYRTISRGGVLYASAPTGTGKTVSALYPALRTLGDGRCDKVFYLTPKSTTSEAVKDCVNLMCERGAVIRAVIMTAKDRACTENHLCRRSKRLCRRAECNNLADATLDLYKLQKPVITLSEVADVSQKWAICPYELMLSYAELCDVVCCDFNHLFDPRAYIRRFFTEGGRYALLVDEAHNLVERSREIYSAEIDEAAILAPTESEILGEHSSLRAICGEACRVFHDTMMLYLKDELREGRDGELVGWANLSEIPERLYSLFDELCAATESELFRALSAKDSESEARAHEIRSYLYTVKRFRDVAARFDECYKLFTFYEKGAIRVKLYCLDTAPNIRERLKKCHGSVLFSATLSPLDYYRAVLGGERSDDTLEVSSPFDPSQLSVTIMDKVSTRFSEREDTLGAVCRVIAATVSAKRGHYMIFSPSFAYSEALSKAFAAKYPKIKIISQSKDMSLREKREFLDNFKREENSYLIAFCVMGGIYSEGVDLAGDSLIGAVVVGIGMPQLSYEREAVAEYYDEKYEMGKQYAYIYPGMNRVFQAAGRVIRREDDRGVIVLIDDRFDDPIYKKSLPALWKGVKFIGEPKRLREILDQFWAEK